MPVEIGLDNLPPFPKRIPEKIKMIRERLGLSPDEIASQMRRFVRVVIAEQYYGVVVNAFIQTVWDFFESWQRVLVFLHARDAC